MKQESEKNPYYNMFETLQTKTPEQPVRKPQKTVPVRNKVIQNKAPKENEKNNQELSNKILSLMKEEKKDENPKENVNEENKNKVKILSKPKKLSLNSSEYKPNN